MIGSYHKSSSAFISLMIRCHVYRPKYTQNQGCKNQLEADHDLPFDYLCLCWGRLHQRDSRASLFSLVVVLDLKISTK